MKRTGWLVALALLGCSDAGGSNADSTGGTTGGMNNGDMTTVPDGEAVSGTQIRLRLLTKADYAATVNNLFGGVQSIPDLPDDTSVAGFRAIGAAEISLSTSAIETYEAAARAIASEVFGTEARWRAHVGCEPALGPADACTTDYVTRFGRLAFRRALAPEEVTTWVNLATQFGSLSGDPVTALSELTATMLQSPNFLYRVDTAVGDGQSARYRYEPYSTASRLAFLLTGAGPSDALLTAAEQGTLGTPEGVRQTAATFLAEQAFDDHLTQFFTEFAGVGNIELITKSANFPAFDAGLRNSLLMETELFVKDVVLGPGADALSFFDSPRAYVNGQVAELYGLQPAGADFQAVDLPPESGRAGIVGKGSFLAAHAGSNSSSPTKRGVFILKGLLCASPPSPPPGIDTTLPEDDPNAPRTTRMKFEQHQAAPQCAGCHAVTDPYGFALEHFDPIGRYRTEENGLPVDSATSIAGTPVDGAVELAAFLRSDPTARTCMAKRFYRYANATSSDADDGQLVSSLADAFEGQAFAWREFLADFAASEAFLSAPTDTRTLPDPNATPEEL